MNLDLSKKLVLGAIGLCVLILVLARVADGPPPEDSDPAASGPGSDDRPRGDLPTGAPNVAGAPDPDAPAPPGDSPPPAATPALQPLAKQAWRARGGIDEPDASDDDDAVEPMPRTIWPADVAGIRGAVDEALPELTECYAQWLKLEPELAGDIEVKFAVTLGPEDDPDAPRAEDGTRLATIPDLDLVSDVEHAFMEGCVADVMGDLWFDPPPKGRLEVTYPLKFRPEGPDPE